MIRGSPRDGISGTRATPHTSVATVEHRRRQRRHEVVVQRVEHAHGRRRDGNHRKKWKDDACELHRQFELAGHLSKSRAYAPTSGVANTMPATTSVPVTISNAFSTLLPEAPRVVLSAQREMPGEGGHEGGAHRPFGEEIADQIRNAERHDEGVHLVAGAEQRRQHLIASQTEEPTGQRGGAGDAGRARQPPLWDLDHRGRECSSPDTKKARRAFA
jgi:hypothetical protein